MLRTCINELHHILIKLYGGVHNYSILHSFKNPGCKELLIMLCQGPLKMFPVNLVPYFITSMYFFLGTYTAQSIVRLLH